MSVGIANKERIGVLTGGGDCPGLNAAIGGVVLSANKHNIEVIGIRKGFEGLIGDLNYSLLTPRSVVDSMSAGGTILGSTNMGVFSSKTGTG